VFRFTVVWPTLYWCIPYTTLLRSEVLLAGLVVGFHPREELVEGAGHVVGGRLGTRAGQRGDAPGLGRLGDAGQQGQCLLRALVRSEEHTSELQSRENLVCRLLLLK